MNRSEYNTYEKRICTISNVVSVPKGAYGITGGSLIGCFVPIFLYPNEILFGHFGPNSIDKLPKTFEFFHKSAPPIASYLYSEQLDNTSIWFVKKERYYAAIERMKICMSEMALISPSTIQSQTYTQSSEIIIDWSEGDMPTIFSEPFTQL